MKESKQHLLKASFDQRGVAHLRKECSNPCCAPLHSITDLALGHRSDAHSCSTLKPMPCNAHTGAWQGRVVRQVMFLGQMSLVTRMTTLASTIASQQKRLQAYTTIFGLTVHVAPQDRCSQWRNECGCRIGSPFHHDNRAGEAMLPARWQQSAA